MRMTDRVRAWCWIASAVCVLAIEAVVDVSWHRWFFLVRGAHWVAIAVAMYYFGRHAGRAAILRACRPK